MKRPLIVPGAIFAAILSAALAGAPQAQAQVIERSVALDTVPDGSGGLNAFFGDTFTGAQSGSGFTDLFTFAVAGTPFDASASVTSAFLDSPGSKDLLITGFSLFRYDPQTLAVIGNAVAGIDLTGFGDNPVDSWALTGLNLASGSYALRVDGQVVGSTGGSFGADLTVSPIPDAPAYALLLAGLLGGGALAWRRGLPLAVPEKRSRPDGAASG
ncbi:MULTISPECIES: FxDxF family PEP-CTERM protein [unclassified Massilia]|uniref:FxDxF family PEP-CTERM protein n=1 Tax=unclassified Massilia TaxID=2609279 RepID=UPI00177F8A48|nr:MULTISPECIES: FxDxF family PEP-CTERM protein [unclassified Massilia]MBD8532875.1 FxDxF family PEP-CTERM protein [Massilia sp. CFBP 13647]MBD8676236.1 FxDxF family PEP-CTERM protein [Massilia sp. CFBP 13721]